MAELVPVGTAETASADFTLTDGQNAMLNLKTATAAVAPPSELPTDARASVQVKTSDNNYMHIGGLNSKEPAKLLSGPGTFRVVRRANAGGVGVDKS